MQIEAIAIYRGAERRVVRFKVGQLNVLTGWPGTGKSALLDIVEYCLGRTEPGFARGALDVVEWYGLLVEHAGARIFVGRPAPSPGAQTNQTAMIRLGATDAAEASELAANADAGTVRLTMSSVIGMEANISPVSETREPLQASIAQALLLCFQGQGEISNPNQLFHRANEPFVGQAIRDTLPYFLGAVDGSHLTRRLRIQQIRRELRQIQREIDELTQVQAESDVRATALVSLAAASGLVDENRREGRDDLTILRGIQASPVAAVEQVTASLREEDRLRTSRRALSDELRRIQEERGALKDVRLERGAYQTELIEQQSRLRSIGLMREVEEGAACPVCGQSLGLEDTSTRELRDRINDLNVQLASARELEGPRRRLVSQLRQRAQEIRGELRAVDAAIASIGRSADARLEGRADEQSVAFVRGRISEFLEGLTLADPGRSRSLEGRLAQLTTELEGIEEAVEPLAVARDVESRLHFVNSDITSFAQSLGLEHASDGIRVDIPNLTIVANNRQGPIPLRRIGSAANQVGYHVVTHLALHKWFAEESRPVPGFLFLDQPEQAYYPADLEGVRDATERLSDLDQERVESLYRFIHDVAESLNGALQVVVVGHWNPASIDWFEDARVENWRDGEALVPSHWLSANIESQQEAPMPPPDQSG